MLADVVHANRVPVTVKKARADSVASLPSLCGIGAVP